MWDEKGRAYRMCIVGNVIGNHFYGIKKEVKSGTKYFSSGTKVYCIFMFGGMGHKRIRVLGKLRNSQRMADVVLSTGYVKNYRLKKVFDPYVIAFIDKYQDFDNTEDIAITLFEKLNKNHKEIRDK